MVDGEGESHRFIVDGTRPANEVFGESDDGDVDDEAEEEAEEEGVEVGGVERERRENETDGDREPEAAIAGDLEEF